MIAKQSSAGISCGSSLLSIFTFEAVDHVYISNLNLFGCKNTINEIEPVESTLIMITSIASNLVFLECTFENNEGVIMISAMYSNITIAQTTFRDNHVIFLLAYSLCHSEFINSTFVGNEGELITYGRIRIREFNVAVATPGDLSTLKLTRCEFRNNYNGLGTLISAQSFVVLIINTKFIENTAENSLRAVNSVISIDRCIFKDNLGSNINLRLCTGDIIDSVYDNNEVSHYGALTSFSTDIYVQGSEFRNIVGTTEGGAIMCYESVITFDETSTFTNNHSEKGGAIYLDRSTCFIADGAKVIIANNTASADGGGIYVGYHSNIILRSQSMLQILENRATGSGGGIYASDSTFISQEANKVLK
jgi:predicted outer membrane repeat protein